MCADLRIVGLRTAQTSGRVIRLLGESVRLLYSPRIVIPKIQEAYIRL